MTKSRWRQRRQTDQNRPTDHKNMLKFLFVIPQAGLVTAMLFLLMVGLIEFAEPDLDQPRRIRLPDIYMPEVVAPVQHVITKPEKPVVAKAPPPKIQKQQFDRIDGNVAVSRIATSKIAVPLDLDIGEGLLVTDGEYLPIVKVAPQYPRRALSRRIEGYVIIEYTVTKEGVVKDPVVVEAAPKGVFDRAALQSASAYKYKPRIVDGQPIDVPGYAPKLPLN